ncbi:MAG: phage integrase N-terminal SAM-like domain-containing protein [Anaerolineae bacterium]|nr:phage integrase N-terminal SAM-like domain-containing protein [Anaerolineae bacterium]
MTHSWLQSFLDDLGAFAAWVQQTYGEPFDPARIVREDVRAWRAHLLMVRRCKPATVNRRLAALRAFCRWAVAVRAAREGTAGLPSR